MKFIDEAEIEIFAGRGGNGCASFRREKFIPFGGPNGGDGGRGGHIGAVADQNINTLIDYHYIRKYQAGHGKHGRGSDCYGQRGKDKILRVPVGTVITDLNTGEQIADLTEHEQRMMLAKGGCGGLGNLHFKSSTNRAPRQKTDGQPGEYRKLRLELKILADVGLLGMPNAGKSTLIAAVSNARPKISDYPFTTLKPHLGVVRIETGKSFVMADIPGLIEGAAEGAGLGHHFLKHLQRTRLLLHLIDLAPPDSAIDPVTQARALIDELRRYDLSLYQKPRWLVLNKVDQMPEKLRKARIEDFVTRLGWTEPIFAISALTRYGCAALMQAIYERLASFKSDDQAKEDRAADPRFREIVMGEKKDALDSAEYLQH